MGRERFKPRSRAEPGVSGKQPGWGARLLWDSSSGADEMQTESGGASTSSESGAEGPCPHTAPRLR